MSTAASLVVAVAFIAVPAACFDLDLLKKVLPSEVTTDVAQNAAHSVVTSALAAINDRIHAALPAEQAVDVPISHASASQCIFPNTPLGCPCTAELTVASRLTRVTGLNSLDLVEPVVADVEGGTYAVPWRLSGVTAHADVHASLSVSGAMCPLPGMPDLPGEFASSVGAHGALALGFASHVRPRPPFVCLSATAVSFNVTEVALRDSRLTLAGVDLALFDTLLNSLTRRLEPLVQDALGRALTAVSHELITPALINSALPAC